MKWNESTTIHQWSLDTARHISDDFLHFTASYFFCCGSNHFYWFWLIFCDRFTNTVRGLLLTSCWFFIIYNIKQTKWHVDFFSLVLITNKSISSNTLLIFFYCFYFILSPTSCCFRCNYQLWIHNIYFIVFQSLSHVWTNFLMSPSSSVQATPLGRRLGKFFVCVVTIIRTPLCQNSLFLMDDFSARCMLSVLAY